MKRTVGGGRQDAWPMQRVVSLMHEVVDKHLHI